MTNPYSNPASEESQKLANRIQEGKTAKAVDQLRSLHPADQAKAFITLNTEQQESLLEEMEVSEIADIFDEMDDRQTLNAARNLPLPFLADILDDMDPDEAADLLGDMSGRKVRQTISYMEEAEEILPLLRYPDETAGGRMTTDFLSFSPHHTTNQVIEYLRKSGQDTDVPYYLFVVDDHQKLSGVVGLRELVCSNPDQAIGEYMDPQVVSIRAMQDQEEAAQVMAHYDLSALPVVDQSGHLVGVISHDDILDVIVDEGTEDIYRLASLADAALEPESSIYRQMKGRLPWLLLNTVTALMASWVISNFGDLFVKVAVLAFFQSVVAAQGGNTASQNVAMMVRSLALGKVDLRRVWPILFRQVWVGVLMGLLIGAIVGIGVGFWQGNPALGMVLGVALLGNMLLASVIGTLTPIALEVIGQDPAMAGTVLVTAITDILGFLIFLSLASMFLPWIEQFVR